MKIVSKLIILALVVVIFSIISCRNDKAEVPVVRSLTSLNDFFEMNGAQSQFYQIDNNFSKSVRGALGTILTFDANSFVTLSGKNVIGKVKIELIEIYDKKMMLLSNVATNAEVFGQRVSLVSGGEIYVNATQKGAQLKLAPGQKYSVFLPSKSNPTEGMYYFKRKNSNDSILWTSNLTLEDTASPGSFPYGYFMNCDSLSWSNCDVFLPNPNYTAVTLNISGTFNASHIKAFIWYDNVNTVSSFWNSFNSTTNSCSDNHIGSGLSAHYIVMSVKNGKLYTAIVGTITSNNAVYNLTLTETKEDVFANSLAALP